MGKKTIGPFNQLWVSSTCTLYFSVKTFDLGQSCVEKTAFRGASKLIPICANPKLSQFNPFNQYLQKIRILYAAPVMVKISSDEFTDLFFVVSESLKLIAYQTIKRTTLEMLKSAYHPSGCIRSLPVERVKEKGGSFPKLNSCKCHQIKITPFSNKRKHWFLFVAKTLSSRRINNFIHMSSAIRILKLPYLFIFLFF